MAFKWFKKGRKVVGNAKNVEEDGFLGNECISGEGDLLQQAESNANSLSSDQSPDCSSYKISEKTNDEKSGFFVKLRKSLSKTRKLLTDDLDYLFKGKKYIDSAVLEGLEERLISSDIGVEVTTELIEKVSHRRSLISNSKDLKRVLKEEIIKSFDTRNQCVKCNIAPVVVMVVGVNGVGKTTTIGKLAFLESLKGNKVLIAAADTFRAAAVEQISICAKRVGAYVVSHKPNTDPAAVAHDGVAAAISRGVSKVFIDTAGRLHTKVNLMHELEKISRSIAKRLMGAPHEILLVLDATTGQNAVNQAEKFNERLGLTGIVLTKLDGSAKGGVAISICRKFSIPIKYIGIGEGMEDLQEFDPISFVDAML